jgi:hypothetical protein
MRSNFNIFISLGINKLEHFSAGIKVAVVKVIEPGDEQFADRDIF